MSESLRPLRSVLAQGDQTGLLVSDLPPRKPRTPALKRNKSLIRPQARRRTSSVNGRRIYSVDDDVNDELDEDETPEEVYTKRDKKYLDGYNDAMRELHGHKGRGRHVDSGAPSLTDEGHKEHKDHKDLKGKELFDHKDAKVHKDAKGAKDAKDADPKDRGRELYVTTLRKGHLITEPIVEAAEREEDGLDEGSHTEDLDEDEAADGASTHSSESLNSLELLNLKARQDAINSTHPFGIKIWKPSIYKKNRSVALRANEDIHDFDPRRPTGRIFAGVYVSNFLWSCTFGLLLSSVCFIGALLVFVFSGFAWHRHLRPYVKLLLQLGTYWFHPFGKFVLLNQDENYLEEDELDGRSISEFHRWRLEDEGRLFFAPPRRMTNAESRPLLKDHKGRPWRDIYESTEQEGCSNIDAIDETNENGDSPQEIDGGDIKKRFFGRGSWSSGRLMFYLFFYGILQPLSFITAAICWLFIFTIPMFNLNKILCEHVRRRPLALHFEKEKDYYERTAAKGKTKKQSIILCTYRCCGLHYYKYTLDGTNIFFFNLLCVVFFVILDNYMLKEWFKWDTWYTGESFLFCGCLFSIIPLAYFIGQAVASISAQSSMGVGAVINAFFSTVVEIFLYCVALSQLKGKLVEGSMIGSILGGVLLLPGLSMCGGALKRKTQRYNPRSAGVSSTMLIFAMVIMFAPSLFYQVYGAYEMRCTGCAHKNAEDCSLCHFVQPALNLDNLYYSVLRPFSILVAVALFLAYICGLYFTLRTHASLIWATNSHEQQATQLRKEIHDLRSPSVISLDQHNAPKVKPSPRLEPTTSRSGGLPEGMRKRNMTPRLGPVDHTPKDHETDVTGGDESGGHDAPNWSNTKSSVILLGATILYAIIAEILVDNVDAVLSNFPINPKFLGLTVFALVPNTTEFVNAISFAVGGNVALSMEIGSAYALQVVLIQIPSLVVYSVVTGAVDPEKIFTLIFPRWDVVATLVSIYLFTYVYAEGKSNYFKGVILVLSYIVVMTGFYLDDIVADLEAQSGMGVAMVANLVAR